MIALPKETIHRILAYLADNPSQQGRLLADEIDRAAREAKIVPATDDVQKPKAVK